MLMFCSESDLFVILRVTENKHRNIIDDVPGLDSKNMNDRTSTIEAAPKAEPTPETLKLYEDARPSVVNIIASHYHNGKQVMGSAGSGFFVRSSSDKAGIGQCELVTDNHVIDIDKRLTTEIEVQLDDGTKHKATVIKKDPAHDLAFLKVEDITDPAKQCKPLTLSDEKLNIGDSTVRLNRTRWEPDYRTGTYQRNAIRKDQDLPDLEGEDLNREFLVFNTFNSTGHQFSGGPYIDKSGKVVAIHEGGQSSDISLATPASDIKEQLDELHGNK